MVLLRDLNTDPWLEMPLVCQDDILSFLQQTGYNQRGDVSSFRISLEDSISFWASYACKSRIVL